MSLRKWLPGRRIDLIKRVGGVTRGGQVGARSDHRQHPSARRHDRAVVAARSARVQYAVGFRAGDDVADPRAAGVVLGGHHDRHRGAVAPPQRRLLGEITGGRGVQQLTQRAVQQRQHRLGLRIAEATVEFDDRRAPRGDRQPGIEQARERAAAREQVRRQRVSRCRRQSSRPTSSGSQGSGA